MSQQPDAASESDVAVSAQFVLADCEITIAVQAEDCYDKKASPSEGDEIGAEVSFVGRVRATEKNAERSRRLLALELEHYPGMTIKALGDICKQASERWDLKAIHVFHRVGRLTVGERIVQVDVASSHRESAFKANAFVMDFLKTSAPFWKKAVFEDGSQQWIEQKQSDRDATEAWSQK